MAGAALRILIVDDTPEDRETYRRLLRQGGEHEYDFLETGSGAEGLALALAERPDCVLLDYRLPDLDGLELLTQLPLGGRTDGQAPPPVIVLTGQGNEAVAVEAMKAGAQDYLVKDAISAQSLSRAVANALENARLRGEVDRRRAELSLANAELRREIAERERAERELHDTHAALEVLVRERTAELSRANAELKYEIAERRRAEGERAGLLVREREARRQAEEANRIKDEFLATLSHELRTPLSAILGWVQILRLGKPAPEAVARGLAAIERNAGVQAQLIAELLDVSRIITGNLRLELQAVELAQVIDAALDSVRPAALAKGIELHPALDRQVAVVMGDATRLQQVVWNLLSNAVKFTPREGRVEVRLAGSRGEVRIEVSDNGIGIAPAFVPFVFDRFRQADSTTTRAHGGLGVGLSIVRHLVELHGGTVRVESAGEGQGATFLVRLPVQGLRMAAQGADRTAADPGTPRGQAAPDAEETRRVWPSSLLAGVAVLVVEDEPDTREVMASALAAAGARVEATASTAEALAALARSLPDVLVSDIAMPGEDGYELIRQVRARGAGRGAELPAAAVTAYAREEDRALALAAGFQAHLAKPFDPMELIRMVARLAEQSGR
jgi:signal transduction histidine kinase